MAEATLTAPDEATTPAAVPDQAQDDADLAEFLTPSVDAGTEPGQEDRTDTETDSVEAEARQAEIRAEAERIAEEKRKEERAKEAEENARVERERQVEGINTAYRQRITNIASMLDREGVSDDLKKAVLDEFTAHNGQAQTFHGTNFTNGLYQALANSLPEDKREEFLSSRKKHNSYADVIAGWDELRTPVLRDGYISKAEADVLVANGKKALLRDLSANNAAKARALVSKASGSPATVQGATTAIPTWEQWNGMTLEQRAEAERRDPQILGKIR